MQQREDEETEVPEDGEIEQKQKSIDTGNDSVIMMEDNLATVDLSKYDTEGKEAHYTQINQTVNQLTKPKNVA